MKKNKFYLIFGLLGLCLHGAPVQGEAKCDRFIDGTDGVGYIESPNYPFDYDNDQNCTLSIVQASTAMYSKVCYNFQRFKLDETHQDYAELKQIRFYGNGSSTDNGDSVWDGFCESWWENTNHVKKWITDTQFVNTGFRAQFQVIPDSEVPPEVKACGKDEWRCLDGSCIPEAKVCDEQLDCPTYEDESYAHARCTKIMVSGMVACDFSEKSDATCNGWSTWRTGWKQEKRSTNDIYGPPKDHTGGDLSGFYLRTQFSWNGPKSFDYVIEIGSNLESDSPYCLSFWYHMRGKDPGSLNLYWGTFGENGLPPWSQKGNHGNQWHRGQLQRKDFSKNKNPVFTVARGGEIDSQIALDDISILKGSCYNLEDISCNFEGTFCNWERVSGDWVMQSAEVSGRDNPPTDSSSRRPQGEFIKLERGNGDLKSPVVTSSNSAACFSFYVFADGFKQVGAITIYQYRITYGRVEISALKVNQTDKWVQYTIDVPKTDLPYQLEMRISLTISTSPNPPPNFILIDEINLIFDSCLNLDLKTCAASEFRCESKLTDQCIPSYLKCNGKTDCKDGSDEKDCPSPGKCLGNEFMCGNGICIPQSNTCNGRDDCGDNSDEFNCPEPEKPRSSFMGSLTVAASASVILLLLIIFAKVFMCYYKRRARRPDSPQRGMFQRRGSTTSASFECPPSYEQCAENLAKYPKPCQDTKSRTEPEFDLPSYDLVQKDQYIQITVPIEDEVRRMKEAMASRNNSLASAEDLENVAICARNIQDYNMYHHDPEDPEDPEMVCSPDSETPVPAPQSDVPDEPPITGAPALMHRGYLMNPTASPVVAPEPAIHRWPSQSYLCTGHLNRAFSGSDLSIPSKGEVATIDSSNGISLA